MSRSPEPRSGEELPAGRLLTAFERWMIYSNLWVSLGIVSLLFFAARFLAVDLDWRPYLLCLSASVLIYGIDHLLDSQRSETPDPREERFIRSWPMYALIVIAALITVVLVFLVPRAVVPILVLPGLIGLLYNVRMFPARREGARAWRRLKDMPGMKASLVALALAVVVVGIPWAYGGYRLSWSLAELALFMVTFLAINTHMFDVRDVSSDRHGQLPTLVSFTGPRGLKRMLLIWGLAVSCLLILGWVSGLFAPRIGLIAALGLSCSYVLFLDEGSPRYAYSLIADGSFFVPMLLLLGRELLGFSGVAG